MKLSQITKAFEERIPLSLQEPWDQCGLSLGHPAADVKSVLFSFDLTPKAIEHAKKNKQNLIVTHHPFQLKGQAQIRFDSYTGQMIAECAKHNIAVYCSHTNHDASRDSLNFHYLKKLGVKDATALKANVQKLYKLVVFVPHKEVDAVMNALFAADAGKIGAYGECSFRSEGQGTFKGDDSTNPNYGQKGIRETVAEQKIETIVPQHLLAKVIQKMIKAHPYEEVAYDVYALENQSFYTGIGAIGTLPKALSKKELTLALQKLFKLKTLRFIDGGHKTFKRVAICTGSGTSLMKDALKQKADVFLTGDIKYHQATEAQVKKLSMVDLGHFHSEIDSMKVLKNIFSELFNKDLKLEVYNKHQDPFETVVF